MKPEEFCGIFKDSSRNFKEAIKTAIFITFGGCANEIRVVVCYRIMFVFFKKLFFVQFCAGEL